MKGREKMVRRKLLSGNRLSALNARDGDVAVQSHLNSYERLDRLVENARVRKFRIQAVDRLATDRMLLQDLLGKAAFNDVASRAQGRFRAHLPGLDSVDQFEWDVRSAQFSDCRQAALSGIGQRKDAQMHAILDAKCISTQALECDLVYRHRRNI